MSYLPKDGRVTHLHGVWAITFTSWNAAIVNNPPISSLALPTITCIVAIAPGAVDKSLLAELDQNFVLEGEDKRN